MSADDIQFSGGHSHFYLHHTRKFRNFRYRNLVRRISHKRTATAACNGKHNIARRKILDNRIDFTATGTEKGVLVCFDDVVKSALNFKKCAVINMHTHPGSNVNPSVVDIRTVYNECCIFYYNDINYIDHIIINGKGQYFSFAEKGIIKQFKSEIKRLQKLILEDLVPEK